MPTFVAHGDVAIVSAEENLVALGDHVAVLVQTRVDGSLGAAGADGLDLGNGVGHLKQAAATLEKMAEEVGTQAEAQNGDVVIVDDAAEGVDLGFREELAFVCNDHVDIGVSLQVAGEQIHFPSDGLAFGLQADAGMHYLGAVAEIHGGLNEPHPHTAFLIVEFGDEGLCRFGRTHCAVFEV